MNFCRGFTLSSTNFRDETRKMEWFDNRYIAKWRSLGRLVTCRVCNRLCERSAQNSRVEHVMSWLGWYPWQCSLCQTRFYVRRK
jgi:hypothetical protein